MSSSCTASSTSTREQAEHFCPLSPHADRLIPAAAFPRSAARVTIAGFFPPISTMQGRATPAPARNRAAIPRPTA
jgi:hypothetical protein